MWLGDRLVRSSPPARRDLLGRLSEEACRIVHGQLHSEDRRCSGTQLLSSVPTSPVLSFVCLLGFVHQFSCLFLYQLRRDEACVQRRCVRNEVELSSFLDAVG